MLTLTECTRQNTCFDCDNQECTGHGDKGADCPKYHCDNPRGLQNCENCSFIDGFIEEMIKNMLVLKEQTELVATLEFIQQKIEGTISEYLDNYAEYGWDNFAETLNNASAQLHMMEVMLRNAKLKHDYMNR